MRANHNDLIPVNKSGVFFKRSMSEHSTETIGPHLFHQTEPQKIDPTQQQQNQAPPSSSNTGAVNFNHNITPFGASSSGITPFGGASSFSGAVSNSFSGAVSGEECVRIKDVHGSGRLYAILVDGYCLSSPL